MRGLCGGGAFIYEQSSRHMDLIWLLEESGSVLRERRGIKGDSRIKKKYSIATKINE